MKRSLSSAIRLYEGNIEAFETPDELIAAMNADSSSEKSDGADAEQDDIDALAALIERAGDTESEPAATSSQTAPSPSVVKKSGESTEKRDGDETEGAADSTAEGWATAGTETPVVKPDGKNTARKGEAGTE